MTKLNFSSAAKGADVVGPEAAFRLPLTERRPLGAPEEGRWSGGGWWRAEGRWWRLPATPRPAPPRPSFPEPPYIVGSSRRVVIRWGIEKGKEGLRMGGNRTWRYPNERIRAMFLLSSFYFAPVSNSIAL